MEIRKDYILDRWVIINPKRGLRPHQLKHEPHKDQKKVDFFAPKNVKFTPPSIGELGKPWKMRWFENKFPIVSQGDSKIRKRSLLTSGNAFGYHEIIVETRSTIKQLYNLPKKDTLQLLLIYQQRYIELKARKGIKYVSIFKNHGIDGGASIVHSHSQIIAYNLLPEIIKQKARKRWKYRRVLKKEKESPRFVKENENFIAFTPFASRYNYEIWLFSKTRKRFEDLGIEEMKDLNNLYSYILKRLRKIGCSFNYSLFLHKKLPFHIEFTPRIAKQAGFELNTDTYVNSVAPEDAAKFYRK